MKTPKASSTPVETSQSAYSKKSQGVRIKSQTQDDMLFTLVVIPPDGGWGWIILISSFLINFIMDGTIYCFGIFLNEIAKHMNTYPTRVAYASSILVGVNLITAPLICGLTNKYGFRKIGFIGGLVVSSVFLVSSYVNHLYLFLIVFGVFGGLGCAMVYIPAVVIVGFYFEKWRALASAISVCGSSVGIICFPLIMNKVIGDLDWTYKFRLLSIGFLIISLLSLTYRPLSPATILPVETEDSTLSVYLGGDHGTVLSQMYSHYHNLAFPTTAEIHETGNHISQATVKKNVSSSSTLLATGFPGGSATLISRMSTVFEDDLEIDGNKSCCALCCRQCTNCHRKFSCNLSRRNGGIDISRPLYRDDIFFTGSVYTLPEYPKKPLVKGTISKKSAVDYHMSVTRVATRRDLDEEHLGFVCCPVALKRILATMLDYNLLKSYSFVCLVTSGFFISLGMYVPFVYITEKAVEDKIDRDVAFMMVTGLGMSNLFGRILCGVLASLPRVNAIAISYIALFIAGIPTILFAFMTENWIYYLYIALYGSSIAAVPAMKTIILVDLLGLDKLTNSFGLTLMFQGLSSFIGLPIAGLFIELTKSYGASFIYCGCTTIISGILLIPVKYLNTKEKTQV